ncbi:hypothetical protein AA0472_0143 [Acetobacter estunensis NRIC 0472]|uniref:Tail fiber protein n=1 Tax=Acetobacter estunensis TaxID=104097 RepID=A0A967B7K5_9PROT|nr:hypothetical protein [Acetobacter estunensis]NHO54614.1 hypothetical protein [Acetobacter estunensis]GBQ20456.1 hypothetical protein AA0472_0143 [Acetobacter estunensis NRIC 0472]
MDRVIVYPAQIVADTDTLIAERNTERAIGEVIALTMGSTGPFATGLTATCSGTNLLVQIGAGQINASSVADASSYGSLAADSTLIMRQYNAAQTSFTLTTATTAQTFHIYATLSMVDTGATMLRYLDASDSTRTLSGATDTGTGQPTERTAIATLALTTGTVPSGSVPVWRIDLPANATSVTQSMITLDNTALFYTKIPDLAPINSPAFTGTPTAPTPASGDSSQKLATTAFVTNWASANLLACDTYLGPAASAGGYNVIQLSLNSRTRFAIIEIAGAGGGGGGGYCRFLVTASELQWPVTATLGAGGRGGQSASTAMSGNSGGNAAFGSMVVAVGGSGGSVAQGGGVAIIGGTGAGGAVQVISSTGITVLNSGIGPSGRSGHVSGVSENYFYGYGGAGGDRPPYYSGGWESGAGQTGKTGDAGSGGSGSCVAPGGTYMNGGDGGPAWMTVTQYG